MMRVFSLKFMAVLILLACFSSLYAQDEMHIKNQMDIQELFYNIANESKDYIKDEINKDVLKEIKLLIEKEGSFLNPFDSLKNVGVLISPNEKLKIITWNIPYLDGTHKYYGFVQFKKSKKKILTFEMIDNSDKIENPTTMILNHKNWYGVLYYKIIENKYRGETFYTLLGADLNDLLTHKKIIEVLHFDKNNEPIFGKKIFKNQRVALGRVIFEFSAQTRMLLTFDEEKQMIVYDHLSPVRPSLVGQYEFYGSDFTHDGLKFERGIWNLYQDIDVRNYNIDF